jgi:hypothetical protein
MINVAARDQLLAEMLALLRPGGTLILADIDNASWLCHPAHPSWDTLLNAFHTVFRAGGGNGFIGRQLPLQLRAVGLEDVGIHITCATPEIGDYRRTHLVSLVDSLRAKIIASGLLSDAQLAEHREALLRHLNDPATVVIDKLFIQSWGRKPG